MGLLRPDFKDDEQTGITEQKLRLLLDKLHGEEHDTYDKLIKFLSERCQVALLKKPLDLKLLTENDVFMLISPSKSWEESEVEAVRTYVESHGGILLALTLDGRKPEHLNELLKPYGLSVIRGTVGEKYLDRDSAEGSQLLEGVESLALGTVWLYESARIAASNEAEVVLQYKDAILGAKRPLGKGIAYLFSCLPAFGNKQLDRIDNRIFLDNILKCLATPAMTGTLEAIAKDEALAAQAVATDKLRTEKVEELKEQRDVGDLIGKLDLGYRGCSDVCKVLGEIGDEKAVAPLIEVLEKSKDDASRQSAALALGQLRAEEAVGSLSKLLEHTNTKAETCYAAVTALAEIGSEQAVRALFRARGDLRVRTSTIFNPLISGFSVGDYAEEQLSKLGEQTVEPLRKLILDQDEDSAVRESALFWLHETDQLALELLGECLVDKEDSMRKEARAIAEDLQMQGISVQQPRLLDPNIALEEQLVYLLDRFLPHRPDKLWFRRPNIPPKKLNNAISSYAPAVSADEVLALGDATIFGSAKKGLLMTKSKLYFNSGAKGELAWSEIQGARSLKGFAEAGLEIIFKTGDTVTIVCDTFKGVRDGLELFLNQVAAANH